MSQCTNSLALILSRRRVKSLLKVPSEWRLELRALWGSFGRHLLMGAGKRGLAVITASRLCPRKHRVVWSTRREMITHQIDFWFQRVLERRS